jgi:hypothetical protein
MRWLGKSETLAGVKTSTPDGATYEVTRFVPCSTPRFVFSPDDREYLRGRLRGDAPVTAIENRCESWLTRLLCESEPEPTNSEL